MDTQILEKYLNEIFPSWSSTIPDLLTYFELYDLDAGEHLSGQRGDIYFISKGAIGKYQKMTPHQYIQENELIIVPIETQTVIYKALTKTKLLILSKNKLYRIVLKFPSLIELYDELRAEQERSINFRITLLQLPKNERLEYFRSRYLSIIPLVSRNELADFLSLSQEYLRKIF